MGVSATLRDYTGSLKFEAREILARDKDFFKVMFKPEASIMGDVIPVNGNGEVTFDK